MFNLLILAIAMIVLTATGSPVTKKDLCIHENKYSLYMYCQGFPCPLRAIQPDEARDEIVLVAEPDTRPQYMVAEGTPVLQIGDSPHAELNMEVVGADEPFTDLDGIYHLSVADMGEVSGSTTPVIGSKDFTYADWYVQPGIGDDVYPKRTSGTQIWYTCNVTIRGTQYEALSWGLGDYELGTGELFPDGCWPVIAGQVHNIGVEC